MSAATLATAADAARIGLWSWNLRTDEVTWNTCMHELTGCDEPLCLPQWTERLAHPDDRPALRALAAAIVVGPLPSSTSRIVRGDGVVRWCATSGTVLAGADGRPERIVGATLDVTEQEETRQRLAQAERMETLGHLAAGVAHNFNNMLMVITPCLEMLGDDVPPQHRESVADARDASERAAAIVRQLLGIAGRTIGKAVHRRRLATLIGDIVRLSRRALPESVSLDMRLDTEDDVECEEGALEQVLTNLIVNAGDALVDAGTSHPSIHVTATSEDRFGERWTSIVVADNGPGIALEVQARIFEPFFTTKVGKGTGLGLASCDAIVSRHGGQLACKSRPGRTEFLVLLPTVVSVSAEPSRSAPPAPAPIAPVHGPRADVLVVDDEPGIQRVLAMYLRRLGYRVHCAGDRAELEALLPTAGAVGVVLLDRSLGGESGNDLLPTLRAALPSAKVLYFSGEHVDEDEVALVDGVIQKPVDLRALAACIEAQLAS